MASNANSSTQNPPKKLPRTDYIDISYNETSPIQDHLTNPITINQTTTLDTALALTIPPPTSNQTPSTQEAMMSPLALRAFAFSTPPSSPLDPEPVLSSCTGRFHCGDETAKNRAIVLAGSVPLHWPVPLAEPGYREVLPTLAYEIKQQG
ncbi:hypothetical protein Tco_0624084 [Tanacetum coccineum]|uniref:Uncharacterized protein n=1 Tax=Tanacetum coccineum TaxID=301880 RepID=A0ABQ4WCZ5_9ASTR